MPGALLEHLGGDALADEEEAREVRGDLRVEVLRRVLGERLGDEDPGVVDEGIDTPELGQASRTIRSAVAGSPMSPGIARMSGSWLGWIERDVATTR
jgi:hypothetical protein